LGTAGYLRPGRVMPSAEHRPRCHGSRISHPQSGRRQQTRPQSPRPALASRPPTAARDATASPACGGRCAFPGSRAWPACHAASGLFPRERSPRYAGVMGRAAALAVYTGSRQGPGEEGGDVLCVHAVPMVVHVDLLRALNFPPGAAIGSRRAPATEFASTSSRIRRGARSQTRGHARLGWYGGPGDAWEPAAPDPPPPQPRAPRAPHITGHRAG
jgi:hypothetical protein